MIKNQWYAVLESHQVKKGKVLVVKRMNEKLAFWRKSDGSIGCIPSALCPSHNHWQRKQNIGEWAGYQRR